MTRAACPAIINGTIRICAACEAVRVAGTSQRSRDCIGDAVPRDPWRGVGDSSGPPLTAIFRSVPWAS